MIDGRAHANSVSSSTGAARGRSGRSSLPGPLTSALLVGAGATWFAVLAVLYLAQRGPWTTGLIPFAVSLIGLDLVLFLSVLLVARLLVRKSFRPMRQALQAITAMTRDRFVQSTPPLVHGADSREIVTMLWQFGRTLTEQERRLQGELTRALDDQRTWQQRDAQARALIDLITEMNQALGLQAVLERLANGVGRFFANDGVGIFLRPAPGSDLQLVVQVVESYPAQLSAKDPWVPLVLAGATQPVRLPGSRVSHPSTAVALTDAHGTAIGIIVLTPTRRSEYPAPELDFLRSVIGHAALAIQNALTTDQADVLSRTDPLTGLQNRREFDRVLKQEIDRATRYQRFLSLVMIDIDHFKQINDQRGQPAGDWALQKVAELVRLTRLRGSDAAFRIGGEEFAILLTETDKAGTLAMAERLRQSTEAIKIFADGASITLSLGVATFPVDARDGDALKRQADRALYEAKNAGRNLVIPA